MTFNQVLCQLFSHVEDILNCYRPTKVLFLASDGPGSLILLHERLTLLQVQWQRFQHRGVADPENLLRTSAQGDFDNLQFTPGHPS